MMDVEPLQLLPEEKWSELEPMLKLDWPRSISVINILKTIKRLPELRRKFDFKIYCPYGDVNIGIVITCIKKTLFEVIIHCNYDMEKFVNAIKGSKILNWEIVDVQVSDRHLMESIANAMLSRGMVWFHLLSCDTLYLDSKLFDVRIPEELTYGLLSIQHVTQVNSAWEHRYPGSEWYFEQLIESKLGYGLFEKVSNKLVAWVFYVESGTFDNLYVLESYRRNGYGQILIQIVYNSIRKNDEYVYTFCVKGNRVALEIFEKIGSKIIGESYWAVFINKTRSKI